MAKRYNHWFWHSRFMAWIAKKNSKFGDWLWRKRWRK